EPAADRDVGPSSQHELERKLARLEELEREVVVRGRTIEILEHENAELTARLAPETPIRAQRRLFLQAVRALQKADAPGTLGKDGGCHKQKCSYRPARARSLSCPRRAQARSLRSHLSAGAAPVPTDCSQGGPGFRGSHPDTWYFDQLPPTARA